MSFQQRTIGEICSELLTEAIRMGYSKRYVWGHMSKYLSIIRGYYRSQHICIFSVEATDACLAFYRIRYAQGTVTRVFFIPADCVQTKDERSGKSMWMRIRSMLI